jgi:integrase
MQEREITHHDHPDLPIRQLTMMYLDYAESYYLKDGKPTSEVSAIRDAFKRLNHLHRNALAGEFSPKMLKAVQRSMIDEGLARTTINGAVARIKPMFRWAVSEELVKTEMLVALETVRELRKGRSAAREPDPVKPVPENAINAVLPHVSRQVRDMIRLQLLSGCRPAEIVDIRPCDVNRDSDVWEYVPGSHKNEHHEKERPDRHGFWGIVHDPAPAGRDSLSRSSYGPLGLDLEFRPFPRPSAWAFESGPVGAIGIDPQNSRCSGT